MSEATEVEQALQKQNERLKRKLARMKLRLEDARRHAEELKKAHAEVCEELEAVKAVVEVYDKHRPQAGEKKKKRRSARRNRRKVGDAAGVGAGEGVIDYDDDSSSSSSDEYDEEDFEEDVESFDKTSARDDAHLPHARSNSKSRNATDKMSMDLMGSVPPNLAQLQIQKQSQSTPDMPKVVPTSSETAPATSAAPSSPNTSRQREHTRLSSDSTHKQHSSQLPGANPIRSDSSDASLPHQHHQQLQQRANGPYKRPSGGLPTTSSSSRRPDVPQASNSMPLARKYATSRDIGISLSVQDQLELYGNRTSGTGSSNSSSSSNLSSRATYSAADSSTSASHRSTARYSAESPAHRNTTASGNVVTSSAPVTSATGSNFTSTHTITSSQSNHTGTTNATGAASPGMVKRTRSKPDGVVAASTDDPSGGRLPIASTGTQAEPQVEHRDQPKIFDENTVRDILCGLSITCSRTFNDDLLVPADYSYSYQFKVRRVPNQLLKFKDFAPKVFQQIRQFWGVDNSEMMHSFGYDNLDAIRGEGKSGAFFIFTRDKRFILKTATGPERDFLWEMLPYYFLYIRKNPNTLLPRFYGVYSMKHEGIGGMVRFVVMNNVFATPSPLNEVYDLKGSTLGRSSGEDVPQGSILKDLDIKRKFHLPDARVLDKFLDQLHADSQFLAQHNVMDYSLLVGVHYDNDEGKEKTRKKLVEWTRYYAEDSSFKSLFQTDGSGMAGWNPDTKMREVYFIGIIDILQKYTPKKKIEHFLKSIPYKANTVSVVEPSFYARRFHNFLKGVAGISSKNVSDAPARLAYEDSIANSSGDGMENNGGLYSVASDIDGTYGHAGSHLNVDDLGETSEGESINSSPRAPGPYSSNSSASSSHSKIIVKKNTNGNTRTASTGSTGAAVGVGMVSGGSSASINDKSPPTSINASSNRRSGSSSSKDRGTTPSPADSRELARAESEIDKISFSPSPSNVSASSSVSSRDKSNKKHKRTTSKDRRTSSDVLEANESERKERSIASTPEVEEPTEDNTSEANSTPTKRSKTKRSKSSVPETKEIETPTTPLPEPSSESNQTVSETTETKTSESTKEAPIDAKEREEKEKEKEKKKKKKARSGEREREDETSSPAPEEDTPVGTETKKKKSKNAEREKEDENSNTTDETASVESKSPAPGATESATAEEKPKKKKKSEGSDSKSSKSKTSEEQ